MATLEIHQINVSQGDSTLIINRDLAAAQQAIVDSGKPYPIGLNEMDIVPFAVANGISLAGTVRKALLIDGGDDAYGGDVVEYMTRYGATHRQGYFAALATVEETYCPNLEVLITHYHDDHIAGLRSLFLRQEEVEYFTRNASGKRVKRTRIELRDRFRPKRIYYTPPDAAADPGTNRFRDLMADIDKVHTHAGFVNRTDISFLNKGGAIGLAAPTAAFHVTTIDLGVGVEAEKAGTPVQTKPIPITLYVVASAQSVYRNNALPNDVPSVGSSVDQNDRSIVTVLEYGSFRYFLGGDIGGEGGAPGGNLGANASGAGKSWFSRHGDIETPLIPTMTQVFPRTILYTKGAPKFPNAGYCTVAKANHHGSSSSNDLHFLATLKPRAVILSAGLKAGFHRHPTKEVMNRLDTAQWPLSGGGNITNPLAARGPADPKGLYVTECARTARGKAFDVDLKGAKIMGDVIVRPVDATIKAAQEATAPGFDIRFQVYGTGEQSLVDAPRNVVRPTEAVNAGPNAYYPIGPYTHSDTH